MILQALVGPKYEILWADVGCNGRASDGTIWKKSDLKNHLSSAENGLHVPPSAPLPGRELAVPYVITGDDAFGLKTFLMKPYPLSGLSNEERIYNYRLSRMRRVSENAFGILANKWRIFLSPIVLEPKKVQMITLAALTLHNFLLSKKASNYGNIEDLSMGDAEVPSSSWLYLSLPSSNNHSLEAKLIRDEFKEYFNNDGAVTWQWHTCGIDR